jgi:hypothetical protein
MKKHRAARLKEILIHKGHDGHIIFAAHGRGDDGVVVIDDLLQIAHSHRSASQVINLLSFRLTKRERKSVRQDPVGAPGTVKVRPHFVPL